MQSNRKYLKIKLILILSLFSVLIIFITLISVNIKKNKIDPTRSEASSGEGLRNVGIFTNGGDKAKEYINTVEPKMIVLFESYDLANQISSDIIVVGRTFQFGDTLPSSSQTAKDDINRILPSLMDSNPKVDVWQAYNEPLFHLIHEQGLSETEAYDWLIDHDLELIKLGKSKNRKVCVGNFKEGWPNNLQSADFSRYASQIMSSSSGTAYLCVHEHEDATQNSGNWKFGTRYNGRFTKINDSGLDLPVLVTVAGFDSKAGPTVGAGSGWNGKIDNSTYVEMLNDYGDEALNSGAKGIALFQLGLGGQWDSFDVYPLLEVGKPSQTPTQIPTSTPTPRNSYTPIKTPTKIKSPTPTPVPTKARSDFDLNGMVDLNDFVTFKICYQDQTSRCDLNSDKKINISDFVVFKNEYLK